MNYELLSVLRWSCAQINDDVAGSIQSLKRDSRLPPQKARDDKMKKQAFDSRRFVSY